MDQFERKNKEDKNLVSIDKKLIHEIVEKVKQSNPKGGAVRFLYFNEKLLLDAAPVKFIMQALKDPDLPSQVKYELVSLNSGFNTITKHCNKEIKDLKRIIVEPKGLYLSNNNFIPQNIIDGLLKCKLKLASLPKEVQEKIIVNNLTSDDVMKPQKGENLDWLSFMLPDGKVFPYTILPENILSKYGFPIGLYTKGDEDVNPKSIKYVYYSDPITTILTKGVYFEVYEGPGPKGAGGINGVIVDAKKTLVIINTNKQEAYFVNVKESRKGLYVQDFTQKGLMITG